MNLEQITLRMAVLEVRRRTIVDQIRQVRQVAEALYAPHRKAGFSSLKPVLPNGVEAGSISIKAGTVDVKFDEPELLRFVKETDAANIEDYVDPAALVDKRVIDLIREHVPEFAAERVKPARRAELREAIADSKDPVFISEAGERFPVASVSVNDPTGDFAYTPGKKGVEAILAALDAGIITPEGEIAGAVPEPTPQPEPGPSRWSLFGDEHGFYDPQKAAAHAIAVQGGYTTPPIEAYRMVRDGGVAAERALGWLRKYGLDPDDPREGEGIGWPLPEAAGDGRQACEGGC